MNKRFMFARWMQIIQTLWKVRKKKRKTLLIIPDVGLIVTHFLYQNEVWISENLLYFILDATGISLSNLSYLP